MPCVICNLPEVNYKCSVCLEPYCCLTCYKTHKENCVPIIKARDDKPETQAAAQENLVTNDTVEANKLEQLKHNENLRSLLKNKHLQDLLITIDKCENAEEIMQKAMLEPIFVEFADVCLQIVQPSEQ